MKDKSSKDSTTRRRFGISPTGVTRSPLKTIASRTFAALALMFCLTIVAALAQDGQPPPDLYDVVTVKEVSNADHLFQDQDDRDGTGILERRKAGLNDIIVVRVENLEALLNRAKCIPPYDQPKTCREQEISLFINGRAIKGLKPESGAPMLTDDTPAAKPAPCDEQGRPCRNGVLRYHLKRLTDEEYRDDNQEHWADLLGLRLYPSHWSLERRVDVSVGLAGEYPLRTEVNGDASKDMKFILIRVRPYRLLFWVPAVVALLWAMRRLHKRYDMLCDRTPVIWPQKRPYSLSLVQAAWWFVIILIVFIFIWLVTNQIDFSQTALILLAIGAGTALGATVIDANKQGRSDASSGAATDDLKPLLAEKQRLEAELDDHKKNGRGPGQGAYDATKTQYDEKIKEIKTKFPKAIGPPREGFWLDILSDEGGVSFHRFQMLVWTGVLGIFFIVAALGVLAMPNFSAMLLGLMGLSSGTYLGFKTTENSGEAATPTNPRETEQQE